MVLDFLRDFLGAMLAVLVVALLASPIVYGVWRGRFAPALSGRSHQPRPPWRTILWGCCAFAWAVTVAVFLGVGGVTWKNVLVLVSIALALAAWAGIALLIQRIWQHRRDEFR